MAFFKTIVGRVKSEISPEAALSDERDIPKSNIKSVQTFTQSRSFKGFRRERITTHNLDGVEKNTLYFKARDYDFTNSAIQLMVVKANTDEGICIRIVVDGRFMGNMYRNERNAETFDNIVARNIDKAHFRIEEATGSSTISNLFVHWPGIGPRVTVE